MLTTEKKLEITAQIVKSKTFKNAPTSSALLQYLVQANIESRFLKEAIIDIEFFGAKPDSDKNNPRVRVNIYNLRKKLKNYYEAEGADDLWQIEIEKGQYAVSFEKQNQAYAGKRIIKNKQLVPYFLLLLLAILLVVTYLPTKKPKIWKSFFTNGHNTNLFIGDAFGYGGTTVSGLSGWTRDFSINNVDEFYDMLEKNPELKSKVRPTDYTYSTRMAENATHDLACFFTKYDHNFEIKYDTRTSFSDIKKGNTIYVGRLKDQKNFVYLFNEANPYFKLTDRSVVFSGHPTIADTSFTVQNVQTEVDYAVVSRIPGPNNTEQFLFFSDHDIGIMATVEYFTNLETLQTFTKEHLKESPYFTAIYKAKGKERIDLSLEPIMVVPFDE